MEKLADLLRTDPKMGDNIEINAIYFVDNEKLAPGHEPVAKMIENAKQKEIQER